MTDAVVLATQGPIDLRDLQRHAWQNAEDAGFHEEGDNLRFLAQAGRPFAESNLRNYYANRLMLIAGEVVEAHEELRQGYAMDWEYFNTDPGREGKPEGVPAELADVLVRLLDLAEEVGIDLADVAIRKMDFNATRGRMHGGKKF